MAYSSELPLRPRSKSRGRRSSSSNISHTIPSSSSSHHKSRSSTHHHHHNSSSNKTKQSPPSTIPLIDMNSIQPFSTSPATPTTTGGATRATAATAATSGSSSEDSRSGIRRRRRTVGRSGSRPRRRRNSSHREENEDASTRRQSRPRDALVTPALSSSSSSVGRRRRRVETTSSPRGEAGTSRSVAPSSRIENRGRSSSRPRSNGTAATSSSRGRSSSIVRKNEPHRPSLFSKEEDMTRGRSRSRLRREAAERGRSLGPLGSAASTSSVSRGRRTSSITRSRGHSIGPSLSSSSSSLRSSTRSRSQSRVRPSHLRASKRATSMETMEEERDEDISEKHLRYDGASSKEPSTKNTSRHASRRSQSRSNPLRDSAKSSNAAAAAIAAALHQVKKSSQRVHDENRRSITGTSHPSHPSKEVPPFLPRKTSRSVSPLCTKSRSKSILASIHQRRRQSASFHLCSPPNRERSSAGSFHSSASSSFSSYDRKITKNFQNANASTTTTTTTNHNNLNPSSSLSSPSTMTRSHRKSLTRKPQPQPQLPHKSSSEMAICPDSHDHNAKPSSSSAAIEAAFQPLLDDDGCCIFHPFIQLQMKLPSGTWRTLSRCCVVCREEEKAGGDTVALSSSIMKKSRRKHEDVGSSSSPGVKLTTNGGDSGECSLTPSVLEENDENDNNTRVSCAEGCGSKRGDDATTSSSRDSVNSQIEHKKTKTCQESMVHSKSSNHADGGTAELPPHEISIPSELGSLDEESVQSKQSVDASSSTKESVSARHSVHGVEQDDAKSTATAATSTRKHREKKSVRQHSSVDMSLVESVIESALQKIKSMDETHTKTAGETVAPSTRSHPPPPPPPPPRSQSSKNLPSKAPSKSIHPPPTGNPNTSSSNGSSLQRPPPPPPPPRPPAKTSSVPSSGMDSKATPASKTPPPPPDTLDYDCSMQVLNPEPEPELQNDDFSLNDFDELVPPMEQMEISGMMGPSNGFPTVPLPPAAASATTTSNVASPPKDWMKYCISASAREGRDTNHRGERKSRLFGRNSAKNDNYDRGIIRSVKQMPYTDQFGDFGLYTGQVNEDGRPDGKGSMKYDNGVFYEGTWTNGGQDQKAALQYERIRGGFTSWQGKGKQASKSGMVLPWNARKNDAHTANEKTNVRGMEWTDLNGDSGRYTGEVNADELPHGHGIMKYDFGLIAEGEWNNGVLKENPQDRLIASAAHGSARSIGPGMSVGPGAHGFNAAPSVMGGMSVGGPASVFTGPPIYPMPYGGMNPMMMAASAHPVSQFAMMAHQNAMMKGQMGMYGGGSVYGGASAYGGGSAYGNSSFGQMPWAQVQGAQPAGSNTPPISEIKIS